MPTSPLPTATAVPEPSVWTTMSLRAKTMSPGAKPPGNRLGPALTKLAGRPCITFKSSAETWSPHKQATKNWFSSNSWIFFNTAIRLGHCVFLSAKIHSNQNSQQRRQAPAAAPQNPCRHEDPALHQAAQHASLACSSKQVEARNRHWTFHFQRIFGEASKAQIRGNCDVAHFEFPHLNWISRASCTHWPCRNSGGCKASFSSETLKDSSHHS